MMNKDQQKTVNKMLDAMELDTYGEKGLKEIIRQSVVEIVKRSAPPKREPLTSKLISLGNNCHESFIKGVRFAEKMHGIGGGE
jgi:hypothetical protein